MATTDRVKLGSPRFVSRLTKNTFGMVLAGGRGSRLKHLTDWRAKPAVPFGGKFRIIDFVLSNCVNSGIRQIGVATQYKSHSLIRHIQRGWSFLSGQFHEFIELMPAQQRLEEVWYRGTADAVWQNLDILSDNKPELRPDPGRRPRLQDGLQQDAGRPRGRGRRRDGGLHRGAHRGRPRLRGDGCRRAGPGGGVPGEAGAAARACPARPTAPWPAWASMSSPPMFSTDELARDAADPASSHDFGQDVIPASSAGRACIAHSFAESCVDMRHGVPYWRDVGTLDAYWEANMELTG